MMGYFILGVACFLVGPSKLFGIYNSPAFILFGLAIMGFGAGMIVIPVLPEMIECIEYKHMDFDDDHLHNVISGLFIAFQGIGETLGPVLGSVLEDQFGFRSALDFAGILVFVFMVFYFLTCGGFTMFKSASTNPPPHQTKAQIELVVINK